MSKVLLSSVVAFFSITNVSFSQHPYFDLGKIVEKAIKGGVYRQPSDHNLSQIIPLFTSVIKGNKNIDVMKGLEKQNFLFEEITSDKRKFIIKEKIKQKLGRGIYLFDYKKNRRLILQVPHGFKDLYTRIIGLRFFSEGNFSVLSMNTVPRNYYTDDGLINADLTHLPKSYFSAFTEGILNAGLSPIIVQIHGFAKEKRKTLTGKSADIILSSGTKIPAPVLFKLKDCLRQTIPFKVFIYPKEINELGGTTNSAMPIFKAYNFKNFIHVELSLEMRKKLKSRKKFRASFLSCIDSLTREE